MTRIFRLNLHDNHDEIAYSLFIFGKVYAKQNEKEKALKYYFDSLFIYREKVGSNNITVGEIIYDIGSIYNEMQQLDLAAKFFREAILLHSRLSDMRNESGIKCQFQLGLILFELSNFDEAILSLKNVIKTSTKLFQKDDSVSSLVIDSFLILGKIHSKLNNFHEAISCLKVRIIIYTSTAILKYSSSINIILPGSALSTLFLLVTLCIKGWNSFEKLDIPEYKK